MTGIELIAQERQEQIEKHGHTIERDIVENSNGELIKGVIALLKNDPMYMLMPTNWDEETINHMIAKSYRERLIIAGAFIAAEIDRLNGIGL